MSSRNYDHLDPWSYDILPNHESYLVESTVYDFCLNKKWAGFDYFQNFIFTLGWIHQTFSYYILRNYFVVVRPFRQFDSYFRVSSQGVEIFQKVQFDNPLAIIEYLLMRWIN